MIGALWNKSYYYRAGHYKTHFYTRAVDDSRRLQCMGQQKIADVMTYNFVRSGNKGVDSVIVARTIVKAIEADNPMTRYAAPMDAKMNISLRRKPFLINGLILFS